MARAEPLLGTASTVVAFLLVEVPGPWGVDAVRHCRLPTQLTATLLDTVSPLGIRPLLIRRHGRSKAAPIRIFAAYADPHHPWMQTAELDHPEQILDLDFEGFASGRSAGFASTHDPVFLTCTHGRHDPCCAEQGRPVARALATSHPAESWEVSHIGGDRFAANVLVLPEGLYYGHLSPDLASAMANRHRSGHLELDHLRGRCGYGFAVQAAEIHLRRQLGLTGLTALQLESRSLRMGITEAVFIHGAQRWRVRLRRTQVEAQLLTCGSRESSTTAVHELLAIEPELTGHTASP